MAEVIDQATPSPLDGRRSTTDTIFRAAFHLALCVIVFLAGALVTASDTFPGSRIARAYRGGKALYDKAMQKQDVYKSDLWFPARWAEQGVTRHVREKAQEGATLYTTGNGASAFLIDMHGDVLHAWHRPFSTVWDRTWRNIPEAVKKPQPDPFVYFRAVHLYPNRDLLAVYEGVGDTPYGYGVVKLDRDSNVIWYYSGRAHHDLSIAPDGKIYVLTHAFVDDDVEYFKHLQRPRLEDFLVVLSPDGKELKKIRLLPALAKSKYRHMLYTVSSLALDDPLHANAVDFIDRESAAHFAFGKEGQVLLSFRETNSLAVIDPATQEIVWAVRGPWLGQHDPDILPNGNILLFDNYANYDGPEGISRVLEFNPRTMDIVWSFTGTPDNPLKSEIRSDQQRLSNGNTRITESNAGRILEVTPAGEIVWQFINPVRGGEDGQMIPIIAWSEWQDPQKVDPSSLKPPPEPERSDTEVSP